MEKQQQGSAAENIKKAKFKLIFVPIPTRYKMFSTTFIFEGKIVIFIKLCGVGWRRGAGSGWVGGLKVCGDYLVRLSVCRRGGDAIRSGGGAPFPPSSVLGLRSTERNNLEGGEKGLGTGSLLEVSFRSRLLERCPSSSLASFPASCCPLPSPLFILGRTKKMAH